ncbi:hypothetical protein PMAYCL1PPCAC_26070, partial [Pristionchus mayeri]
QNGCSLDPSPPLARSPLHSHPGSTHPRRPYLGVRHGRGHEARRRGRDPHSLPEAEEERQQLLHRARPVLRRPARPGALRQRLLRLPRASHEAIEGVLGAGRTILLRAGQDLRRRCLRALRQERHFRRAPLSGGQRRRGLLRLRGRGSQGQQETHARCHYRGSREHPLLGLVHPGSAHARPSYAVRLTARPIPVGILREASSTVVLPYPDR